MLLRRLLRGFWRFLLQQHMEWFRKLSLWLIFHLLTELNSAYFNNDLWFLYTLIDVIDPLLDGSEHFVPKLNRIKPVFGKGWLPFEVEVSSQLVRLAYQRAFRLLSSFPFHTKIVFVVINYAAYQFHGEKIITISFIVKYKI